MSEELDIDDLTQVTLDVEDLKKVVNQFETANLKSISPGEGIKRYLKRKQSSDLAPSTIQDYRRDLERFETFCEQKEIDDLSELDGMIIDEFASWLQYDASEEVDELAPKTMRDQMYLLRDFVRYLEHIEAVKSDLSDSVRIPDLNENDGIRNAEMNPSRVEDVLTYLNKFKYATLDHVVWKLGARIARRQNALIGLDLCDVYLDVDDPYIEFQHRPPETRLKNGENGEGRVAITDHDAEILQEYIDNFRPDITDEYGRSPLLTTSQGRLSRSAFRRIIYKWSRPCQIGNGCPHNRDPEDCEATQSSDHASKCPSSHPPHVLRHGFISEACRQHIPKEVISDRCDVSEDIIEKHYNESTQNERYEIRREILDEYTSDNGGGYL